MTDPGSEPALGSRRAAELLTNGPIDGIAYSADEAAVFLHTTAGALLKQAQRAQIPHTRIGRRIRFTKGDIEEILASGHRPSQTRQQPAPRPGSPRRISRTQTPQPQLPGDTRPLRSRPEAARKQRDTA